MTPSVRPEVQTFLDRFFNRPNLLKADSKPEIRHWVDRLTRNEPLPTPLPCWREGSVVDWYGLAFDARQLRTLGESLTAFVGPTYTTFRGQIARLDSADPIEKAVEDLTRGNAYHFRGADPAEIWKALERMRKVWERRGIRERAAPAPVGRVLRDFYMAIHAGDQPAAEERLSHLRQHYHLDSVNLLYLRVQLLAAFQRSADLLALAELPDLLRLRRPSAVTEALLRAVYQIHLARFEEQVDAAGAAQCFRSEVQPRFGSLFAARGAIRSPEAIKGFMLHAVVQTPPDITLCNELLALGGQSPEDTAYLSALAVLAGPQGPSGPTGDPITLATEAAQANDFDRAFGLAIVASASTARARILCECAFELGTLAAKAAAIDAVNVLGEADRSAFLTRRINQQLWESLQEEDTADQREETQTAEPLPTDWGAWLEHLDRTEGRKGSREIARQAATEWSVADLLSSSEAVARFAGQLAASRSQTAEYALRDSLPHLLAFFAKDPAWPNPILKAVYRPLLELLFFSTDGGRADLVVFNELLESLLTLGPTSTEYSEFLSYAADLWSRFAAPANLVWATDALALLAAFPCPNSAARQGFLQSVLDRASGFSRQVGPEDRALLRLISRDLGLENVADSYFPKADQADSGAGDIFAPLRTMSVAAYTLTERAGKQFQSVLESLAPGVRVSLAHDLHASARLKQLARQADLFMLVTSSAKHAATDCVRANRPAEKPTLLPTGKGAASLLASVRGYFESRAE